MATERPVETEAATTKIATKLKLDPPEALQPVAPAEAAGLVPLKAEETSELDKRVAQFVDELAKLDSNPQCGTLLALTGVAAPLPNRLSVTRAK